MSEALVQALGDACWANTCDCDTQSPESVIRVALASPQMDAVKVFIRAMLDEVPELSCPYLLQDGSEGAYGPNTCSSGCSDEPSCVTGSFPVLPPDVREWVLS